MEPTTLAIIIVVVCSAVYVWITRPIKKYAHIPGPAPAFLTGNYSELKASYYGAHQRWSQKYGPIAKVVDAPDVLFMCTDSLVYSISMEDTLLFSYLLQNWLKRSRRLSSIHLLIVRISSTYQKGFSLLVVICGDSCVAQSVPHSMRYT